jgi:predicted DNA-binding transcriptional regulator AlpA
VTINRRPSSRKKDTVLKQGVGEGEELEPGSSVALVIAAPYPRVPSVVGKQEASAIRKLKNAGFQVKKTTQTRSTEIDTVAGVISPLGSDWCGVRQVAKFLGVQEATVRSWVSRQRMPEPDGHVGRTPVWRGDTVREWARNRPRKGREP